MTTAPEPRWPLDRARKIAERIREELRPYCERIEIAGSIRRERPEVGDIDLVALPIEGREHELRERFLAATRQGNARILAQGADNLRLVLANGLQVDLFVARHPQNDLAGYVPGNFGMRLLAMTGSKEHNIELARTAEALGYHFHPYRGLLKAGAVYRAEDELEILRALGLGWIDPTARNILSS